MKTILLLILLTLSASAAIDIGVVERVKTITANYTAQITDDNIFVNASAGNVVVTMPNASLKPGKAITLTRTDTSAYVVTVGGEPLYNGYPLRFVSTGSSFMNVNPIKKDFGFSICGGTLSFNSAPWGNLTGSVTCTNSSTFVSGNTSAFGVTVSEMKANVWYRVKFQNHKAVANNSSNHQCDFRIYDGTQSIITNGTRATSGGNGAAESGITTEGVIKYSTGQTNKTFYLQAYAGAVSGSGTCRCDGDCMITVEEM